jgi:hypothetical protein
MISKKYRIRNDRLSPLILITELGSEYASAAGDKDDLVSRYNPSAGDLLLWAWVGKNRTDVFVLQKDDLDRYYP